jgi:hypothetical protein
MTKSTTKIIDNNQNNQINASNVNRGNPIYFKNVLHYIVYEFQNNIIISKNEDLSKAYCVTKKSVSVKPKK